MNSRLLSGLGILLVVGLLTFTFGLPGRLTELGNLVQQEETARNPEIKNDVPETLQEFKETVERQAKEYPETFFLSADIERKEIALTFDDGPDRVNTPQILDILKDKEVKATFFLLGKNVEQFPELTKRIKEEGHQLANHSWTHPNFEELDNEQILNQELKPTSEIIEELTGRYPRTVRPPFGTIRDDTIEFLGERDWSIVNWSVDSFDWHLQQEEPEEIIAEVTNNHHPGGIILMHDGEINKITVQALPEIIEDLKNKQYEFKTVNQLLFNQN